MDVEIQEAITDELMSKQRNLRQLSRKCMTAHKPVYMPVELILNKRKEGMCLPHAPSIFKKIDPKTSGLHCVGHYFIPRLLP